MRVCVQKDTRAYYWLMLFLMFFVFLNFWYRLQCDIVLRRCYLGVSFFLLLFGTPGTLWVLVTLGIGYVRSVPNLFFLLRSEG